MESLKYYKLYHFILQLSTSICHKESYYDYLCLRSPVFDSLCSQLIDYYLIYQYAAPFFSIIIRY